MNDGRKGVKKWAVVYLMYKRMESGVVENSVERVEKRRKIPPAASKNGGKPGGKSEKLPARLNGPPKHDTITANRGPGSKRTQGRISSR